MNRASLVQAEKAFKSGSTLIKLRTRLMFLRPFSVTLAIRLTRIVRIAIRMDPMRAKWRMLNQSATAKGHLLVASLCPL